MAKKRKNANYATEKNKQKKLEREKQKRNREIKKRAILLGAILAAVAVLALAVWGILALISNNFDPHAGHNHESEESSEESSSEEGSEDESVAENAKLTVTHHASIKIQGYDEIIHVELYGEEAPITVANFVKLANEGFYDGLTFHRIISNIVQGGDPDANGYGGSDEQIKGEFSLNGVENNVTHSRGVISMARSSDYDSASSQFFILTSSVKAYDGSYAGFGMVTDGMDVIDDLASKFESSGIPKDEQPVIEYITIHEVH